MRYIIGWLITSRTDRTSPSWPTWVSHKIMELQGSVLGPPSNIIVALDLHPRHLCNVLVKYAIYLLVGSSNFPTALEEFVHIILSRPASTTIFNPTENRELIAFRKSKEATFCSPPHRSWGHACYERRPPTRAGLQWGGRMLQTTHDMFDARLIALQSKSPTSRGDVD